MKILTGSRETPKIFAAPTSLVLKFANSLHLGHLPGIGTRFDLRRGEYEGGYKVWECTTDLVRYILTDLIVMSKVTHMGDEKFRALELGAGAALPTIALLHRITNDPHFHAKYRIHVQDFNWQVLASFSLLNMGLNFNHEDLKFLLRRRRLRFLYGDWSQFQFRKHKYDLIFMSEVLYDEDNYKSLHEILEYNLKYDGYILIATKNTYFGCSGDLRLWLKYVESQNRFHVEEQYKTETAGVPRTILVMRRLGLDPQWF